MTNGQKPNKPLFYQHYLEHRLQKSPTWQLDVKANFKALNKLYLSQKSILNKNKLKAFYSSMHLGEIQSINRKTCRGGVFPPSIVLHPTDSRHNMVGEIYRF